MVKLSSILQKIAYSTLNGAYWSNQIHKFGVPVSADYDQLILRQIFNALNDLPVSLIKDCKISKFLIRDDMGPNKPYYPNHGYYHPIDQSITLNSDIYYHPDDFFDTRGYYMARPRQTLFHEMGHAFDEAHGLLSKKPEWLRLSGWSETPKPGLKRIIIRDPGTPEVVGEWFYNPKAEFTRYYGKRNPWDDFADTFCFYVGGLRGKVPESKEKYFDKILGPYYKR